MTPFGWAFWKVDRESDVCYKIVDALKSIPLLCIYFVVYELFRGILARVMYSLAEFA